MFLQVSQCVCVCVCVVVTRDCLIDYFVELFAKRALQVGACGNPKKKMQNARLQQVGCEKNNEAKVHIDSL